MNVQVHNSYLESRCKLIAKLNIVQVNSLIYPALKQYSLVRGALLLHHFCNQMYYISRSTALLKCKKVLMRFNFKSFILPSGILHTLWTGMEGAPNLRTFMELKNALYKNCHKV